MYNENEFLQLSGIQHFSVCKRQWALIHLERAWEDSVRTKEGDLTHETVDDPFFIEKRGDTITSRSMPVRSFELGLNGICDVVEFRRSKEGVTLRNRQGKYEIFPVEYKVGSPKLKNWDLVQLCAQVISLEEMFNTQIDNASLYYATPKRRSVYEMNDAIRNDTRKVAKEMHELFLKGITPSAIKTPICNSCSLINKCMPNLSRGKSIKDYMESMEM